MIKLLVHKNYQFTFIISNLIFLVLNLLLLTIKLEAPQSFGIPFYFTDKYIIKMLKKKYEEISYSLNIKFKNNNPGILYYIKESFLFKNPLKKIKLDIIDTYNIKFQKNWFNNNLGNKFDFEFDSNSPDFLIFNIFGNNYKNNKYDQAVKIAFYTENIIPDFHNMDYAIARSHINYLDRFFQFPLLVNRDYGIIEKKRKDVLNKPIRQKFCAAVISNGLHADKFRLKFINELNKYKTIDMGGSYLNNIGSKVKDKIAFLNSYKFSIAMENSDGDGYSTEKLIDSFESGTIPIYYGDYMVDEFINPKSYILIKGEKDLYQKIQYIISLDNDVEKYKSVLKENVIIDKYLWAKTNKELKEFFLHIFNQEKFKAFRRDNY